MTRKAEKQIEDTVKDGGEIPELSGDIKNHIMDKSFFGNKEAAESLGFPMDDGGKSPEFQESPENAKDLAIEAKKLSDNSLISRTEAKEQIIKDQKEVFFPYDDKFTGIDVGEPFTVETMATEASSGEAEESMEYLTPDGEEILLLKGINSRLEKENAALRAELSNLTGTNNSTNYQEFIANPQNKKEFDELVKSIGLKECPQDQLQAVINIIIQRRK